MITPKFTDFKPLPSQSKVIYDVFHADYKKGTHEFLLSGSVGSSKSLTMAHIGLRHVFENPGCNLAIGRLALPQLKATLCNKIKEHLFGTGVDYYYSEQTGCFRICNGSKITAISWSDNNFAKLGSFEFSSALVEEVTESRDKQAWDTLSMRVGRLRAKQNFLLGATNPSGTRHWAYDRLITSEEVRVYYSVTSDNPYLPPTYIEKLLKTLDPKMARRMIFGEWVDIESEGIYYEYKTDRNYRNYSYNYNPFKPLYLAWDFNIGDGKPLSVALMQKDEEGWHIFNECVIDKQSTPDCLDELASRDVFEKQYAPIVIRGDRNGKNSDTRNNRSDYEIIEKFLGNYQRRDFTRLTYKIEVPTTNPPIRERHNLVNGMFGNAKGETRLWVYKDAPTADKGFRTTAFKKGASAVEDDSSREQHITTAIGYCLSYENKYADNNEGNSFKSYKR